MTVEPGYKDTYSSTAPLTCANQTHDQQLYSFLQLQPFDMAKNSNPTEARHKRSLDTCSYWSIHREASVSLIQKLVRPTAWIWHYTNTVYVNHRIILSRHS